MQERWSLAAIIVVGLCAGGCGVQRLPPAAAPPKEVPSGFDVPTDPPAPGTGRVLLETNGEPAKVMEITGSAMASAGRYSATVVGVRPVCTTPCVVDLSFGSHPLALRSIDDETRQSETEIEVGPRPKIVRHALGERKDGGAARPIGATLLTLGLITAGTGAFMWLLASASDSTAKLSGTGQMITGIGALSVGISIPLLILGRPTERPGSTTQWTLPGGASPTAIPQAPAGSAVNHL